MLHMLKQTCCFLIFLVMLVCVPALNNQVHGQGIQNMKDAEDSLAAILKSINNADEDSLKYVLNDSFYHTLLNALMLPASDNSMFESLKTLIKISSDDGKFRIFHWNLPTHDGKKRYFGFLKLLNVETPTVFPLRDYSDSITSPESALLDYHHWFGALYYTSISCTTMLGKKYYTLLGWAGNDATITQKVIEILSFDDHNIPQFGLPVFPNYEAGTMTRIIFRYAASTSMSLKYEEQIISSEKKWNPRKRDFDYKTKSAVMIVFDRLVPIEPQLEGQFQFYITDGNIFDAFQFVNGSWNFIQGIESKNKH